MKFYTDKKATYRVSVLDCDGDIIFTKNDKCFEVDNGWLEVNKNWHFQNITIQGTQTSKYKIMRFFVAAKRLWSFV